MTHRKVLQVIMSAPAFLRSAPYTTKSGQVKRRKLANPYAKPFITSINGVQRIKTIKHQVAFN